jgi:hypothetical protein
MSFSGNAAGNFDNAKAQGRKAAKELRFAFHVTKIRCVCPDPRPGRASAKLRRHEVFNAGDVKYGAFSESFRQPVWVRIQSDFDGVAFDESSVMVCDVERFPVRQANSERLEWLAVYPVFKLLRVEHTFRAQSCLQTA